MNKSLYVVKEGPEHPNFYIESLASYDRTGMRQRLRSIDKTKGFEGEIRRIFRNAEFFKIHPAQPTGSTVNFVFDVSTL